VNGMDRILGTLAGNALDRRAFIPVLSLYGARLTQCPLETYYTDPMAYARGQIAVQEQFEPDMLFGPFAFASIGAAFGSEVPLSGDQAPNIRRPGVPSVEAFDRLVLPDPDSDPHLLYFREAIRRLTGEFRGEVPIAACLAAPIDLPVLAMGMETWLETLLFDTAGAQRILDKMSAFFVRFTNCLFADGATVAFLPCGFASPTVLVRHKVESLLRPALQAALGQLAGPAVLHHAGASLLRHLDLLTGLPAVVGFALRHEEGLAEARRVIGPDPVLLSGPHGPSLAGMDAASVERTCLEILEERRDARDARFILVTLGADVPLNTPPENIHAMRRALTNIGWDLP
jgi:uroporphyrinogen decarboxylase